MLTAPAIRHNAIRVTRRSSAVPRRASRMISTMASTVDPLAYPVRRISSSSTSHWYSSWLAQIRS